MARRPRENPVGGTHHVFTRGMAKGVVAVDDEDFERTLRLLGKAIHRFDLRCHAWCYLPNHMHILVTCPLGNLSDAMKWYLGCAAQTFNARHGRVGHVFQGRFGSRVVEDDRYFFHLVRYIALNPVKAGICETPEGWEWSSYAATAGLRAAPDFLHSGEILGELGSARAYVAWVAEGVDCDALDDDGVPRRPPLAQLLVDDSDAALASARFLHGYAVADIARHLGAIPSTISRRLARVGSDPIRAP
jgi:putative transposase